MDRQCAHNEAVKGFDFGKLCFIILLTFEKVIKSSLIDTQYPLDFGSWFLVFVGIILGGWDAVGWITKIRNRVLRRILFICFILVIGLRLRFEERKRRRQLLFIPRSVAFDISLKLTYFRKKIICANCTGISCSFMFTAHVVSVRGQWEFWWFHLSNDLNDRSITSYLHTIQRFFSMHWIQPSSSMFNCPMYMHATPMNKILMIAVQ